MADNLTTAHVSESGESRFAVSISVSGHAMIGDEPEAMGGKDLGPAPYDLLSAALAECTCMTIRWYAEQQKWPLEHVEVVLTHQKGGEGAASARQDVFTKRIKLTGPALTPEQHAKLIEVAAKCPVQRSLEGTPLIRTLESSE